MGEHTMFHQCNRDLQDAYGSRRLADRLVETLRRDRFTEADRNFIEQQTMFFLATTDASGFPDCSFKGGAPGFVRVVDDRTIAFPSYDGNGMFKSLGNIQANPRVGLLFITFEQPKRLRVNGTAELVTDPHVVGAFVGAQLVVRVTAAHIFPNCPRYIPKMVLAEPSRFLPLEGVASPVPDWKRRPEFNEVLPDGDPAKGHAR